MTSKAESSLKLKVLEGGILCLCLAVSLWPQQYHESLPDLDSVVPRVMKVFEVPGIGLAVVKDGKVIVTRGYGIKDIRKPGRIDRRTLFGIASNTKAFTATALGLLVEEGRINWDDPVIRYLPWFRMWDLSVTRELTVRDLLVHRSGLGLGAGDLLLWPASTYTRSEIVRRLRFIRPAHGFRSTYAYDNILYLAAGEVIRAVSGQTWENFVVERILTPAGMEESQIRHKADPEGWNIAMPHAVIEGLLRPLNPKENDNINPAGGILSNADDMAKWMLVHLNEGRLASGSRLFSEETSRELTTIVTPMKLSSPPAELRTQRMSFRGYALGFQVHDYLGRTIVTHTGGLAGYVSKLTLVPELELGILVLTNQEAGEAYHSVTYQILDHYLEAPETDWTGAYLKVKSRREKRTKESRNKTLASRVPSSRPSLAHKEYAGLYNDAWYGTIEIAEENGNLSMRFLKTPGLVGDIEHWRHDTFIVRWRDRTLRADAFVTFTLNPEGSVERAAMKPVFSDTDFSYDFQDLLLRPVRRKNGFRSE
jgi:CubicO group peptidase (beta-lactamase class C family)